MEDKQRDGWGIIWSISKVCSCRVQEEPSYHLQSHIINAGRILPLRIPSGSKCESVPTISQVS